MTERATSIEQLSNEIVHLREQNQTLSAELAFHRKIFQEVNQVLGAVSEVKRAHKGSEAIRKLLHENQKLQSELKVSRLSEREREVLSFIAKGYTSKKIAEKLNISKLTVDTHRKHIQHKLEVSNMVEMVKVAIAYELR